MSWTRRALGATGENWWALGWYQSFFYWRIFTKFQPQKYHLDLYRGFFMEKMNKIRQIWKTIKSKLPDFYDKLY